MSNPKTNSLLGTLVGHCVVKLKFVCFHLWTVSIGHKHGVIPLIFSWFEYSSNGIDNELHDKIRNIADRSFSSARFEILSEKADSLPKSNIYWSKQISEILILKNVAWIVVNFKKRWQHVANCAMVTTSNQKMMDLLTGLVVIMVA